MKVVWKGDLCEILEIGEDTCRLYCEGISQSREDFIVESLFAYEEASMKVQSRTNGQFDGALIIDFHNRQLNTIISLFGGNNGK